ncbi:putative transcriptional regulator [Halovivax ruber XH-70]|uniref:Putative transcriptional regulator n=1 Tax=Halovivax ruber (strain DSM 18193 / JCM 13892 / XH-70) TaxID=797302 RepID=L0IAC4_HALRX|nr:helix-turn-helix transcriptional regulator [Halovivax ruber]AGB15191.1 putative transcriptional regulator [Halovivax ruber XH-70]
MRDTTPNDTHSVLEELATATQGADSTESYDITIGTVEDATHDIEADIDELMKQVRGALPTDDVQFDEAIVKENLEEVLLMLISLHGETHGKELLSDLSQFFGTQLSPGTVYPSLHALEDEEVLSMHAKVRTKEYAIDDEDAVRGRVERTMVQHLAFGLLLYAFLPRL